MSDLTFDELFERIRTHDESLEIEAKRGSDVGKAIMETVCAYANEPGRNGGYLLLGVERDEVQLFPDYEVVGIEDSAKVQHDLISQCSTIFNSPIRPQIWPDKSNGKDVLVVYVPESAPSEKPVFFKATGLPKGAYRRIGASDQRCTEDDIALLYQGRTHKTYEDTVLEEVLPEKNLADDAIQAYRRRRAAANPSAEELGWSDTELLDALSATSSYKGAACTTVCGLMAFGSKVALRRIFPMTRVDYIRVPGRSWMKNLEEPFETLEMRDPLLLLIPKVISTVLDDIPKGFHMDTDGVHRQDLPLIPERVIREVVVNALMHRNYRTRQPVQIIRYSNRIEFKNPGCSLKPDDRLGEPGSVHRNEKIAAILHECNLAETKGSGIRVMRELMEKANLTLPLFESDRDADTFSVTLLTHHFMNAEDIEWLSAFRDCELSDDEARALVFTKEVEEIDNAAYRDINKVDSLTASGHLRKLRNRGLLEQRGKGSKTYYIPGKRFKDSLSGKLEPLSGRQNGLSGKLEPEMPDADSLPGKQDVQNGSLVGDGENLQKKLLAELPNDLQTDIQALRKRVAPKVLDGMIHRICIYRPMSKEELASLLGRSEKHMQDCLRRMQNSGQVKLLYPDARSHPEQKYIAHEQSDDKTGKGI